MPSRRSPPAVVTPTFTRVVPAAALPLALNAAYQDVLDLNPGDDIATAWWSLVLGGGASQSFSVRLVVTASDGLDYTSDVGTFDASAATRVHGDLLSFIFGVGAQRNGAMVTTLPNGVRVRRVRVQALSGGGFAPTITAAQLVGWVV